MIPAEICDAASAAANNCRSTAYLGHFPIRARPGPPGWFVSVHPLGQARPGRPPSVARKPIFTHSPPCRHAWRRSALRDEFRDNTVTQSVSKVDNYFPGFLDHHFASPRQKAIKRSPSSQLFLAAVAESVFITDRLSVRPTERTC